MARLQDLIRSTIKSLRRSGISNVQRRVRDGFEIAPEMLALGYDGDGGGSGLLVLPADRNGIEIRTQQSRGRGCLLDFRDDGRRPPPEGILQGTDGRRTFQGRVD